MCLHRKRDGLFSGKRHTASQYPDGTSISYVKDDVYEWTYDLSADVSEW